MHEQNHWAVNVAENNRRITCSSFHRVYWFHFHFISGIQRHRGYVALFGVQDHLTQPGQHFGFSILLIESYSTSNELI